MNHLMIKGETKHERNPAITTDIGLLAGHTHGNESLAGLSCPKAIPFSHTKYGACISECLEF